MRLLMARVGAGHMDGSGVTGEETKRTWSDRMEEKWCQYMLDLDGQPGSCIVNLAHGEHGPDPRRPFCLLFSVPLAAPSEDGLGNEPEIDSLRDFEDRVLTPAAAELDIVLVASVRGAGRLDFWYYAPADCSDALLQVAAKALPTYDLEAGGQDDPEWSQYFTVLFPDDFTLRQLGDESVITALREAGDECVTPRPIEHLAIFESREDAVAFAARIAQDGFALEGDAAPVEDDEGRWLVDFSNDSTPDFDSITPVTARLEELAAEHNGAYDGWQTQVIRA